MLSLEEIEVQVRRLAGVMGTPESLLPTLGRSEDFGRAHIEVDAQVYHLVVVERGCELSRITTDDVEEILYRVFDIVTFSLAADFELKNRIKGQDSRRVLFRHQLKLLGMLRADWESRRSKELECVMQMHPFDDLSSARAVFCQELREQGHSAEEARKIAVGRYPVA